MDVVCTGNKAQLYTYLGSVDCRSIAGGNATAKQTNTVQWSIIMDLCHCDLVHDRVLREGAGAHELQDRLTATGEACGGI